MDVSIDLPDRLPDLVEIAAYYLVAESLANANKHSGATLVTTTVRVIDGVLVVTVSDDGRGGAVSSGSGLVGLADRLGALGGHLVVDSEPGHGTTITGTIPMHAPIGAAHHLVDDILLRVVPEGEVAGPYAPGSARHERWLRGDMDRRRRALKWIAWQTFAVPGEIVEAQAEAEDILHAKAMLLMVGGNREISKERRDWIIGYLTAAGYSESVLEAARSYDDSDTIEDIMRNPRIALARLVMLHDSLRACVFDSDALTPGSIDPVLRAADAIGIPRDVVADLHAIVLEEQRLRKRRNDIIVAPAMPKLLNDSIAITTGAPDPA